MERCLMLLDRSVVIVFTRKARIWRLPDTLRPHGGQHFSEVRRHLAYLLAVQFIHSHVEA